MSLINFGGGLSAAGSAISSFAGTAGLAQQKADLEKQQIVLASLLKGEQYDVESKKLAAIPQRLSIDAYLKATGHPGGLADFGEGVPASGDATTGSSAAPSAQPSLSSSDGAPAPPSVGSSAPSASGSSATPSDSPPQPGGGSSAFPKGAPVVTPIGDKGKVLGIPLPPGWTPQMAAISGPDKLAAAWAEFSKPGNLRPGSAMTFYDFATGKVKQLYQQPNTPQGYLYDADTQSYVQIGHGLEAIRSGKAAEASGTAEGELPAKEQFAGYQKGLDMATNLVDSYDPKTQATVKVTQGDALKIIRGGGTVASAPVAGAQEGSATGSSLGLQKDGSYKTPEGTTIPAPPKIETKAAGFQTEPSAAQKATQADYADTIKGWNEAILPAAQSEQRFMAMANALKSIQSGAWATAKADIARQLSAAGMDDDTAAKLAKSDPAQAQIILKNNFGAALTTLGASKLGRITQNEIFAQQKNLANPDLQPAANLAIIAQGVGVARFQQNLAEDWNTASRIGYADPASYQAAWIKANPIQGFIDQATKEIGPLKGMKQPTAAPTAGVPKFASPDDPAFKALPDGSQFMGPDGTVRIK